MIDVVKCDEAYPQVTCDATLMVCLCDLSADDFATHLAGIPIAICDQHKAVKLESMASLNVGIRFARIDEIGDIQLDALQDAMKAKEI